MVWAKFACVEIIQSGYSNQGQPVVSIGKRYKFSAVYSNVPDSENKKFFTATPDAKLEMYIDNPAGQIFELGKEYYLDFTPAN